MKSEFFPQKTIVNPTIYAYELPNHEPHKGFIKIGYTTRSAKIRVAEQAHIMGLRPKILLEVSAVRSDGTVISDTQVRDALKKRGFKQLYQGEDKNEWVKCTLNDVKSAINYVRDGIVSEEFRTETFKMREEQELAVQKTIDFFNLSKKEDVSVPKFLWNAKMRFGKTFTAYQLARRMNLSRILILTFKPAVEASWRDDLMTHVDFEGWQFISNRDDIGNKINIDYLFRIADKKRPIVVFGSFQDLLGTTESGGIKAKNEFIHTTNWDLVIFDEYHYGAWRENAKKLFENPDEEELADFDYEKYTDTEADDACNETFLPITTSYYLFLSGTPFRAINSGEFIEDQIYNWTYADEQRMKEKYAFVQNNQYEALPRMVMLTYSVPDSIRQVAVQGELNEFDLNAFFEAKGKGEKAKFVHENEVQKWLDLIRGAHLETNITELKLGQAKRAVMPYSDTRLLNVLSHTLWFLPNVSSCFAMANLLAQKQNTFYQNYKIKVCAGAKAGVGVKALYPILDAMDNPLKTKTITLSCGKLTTGVTVRPWSGVFMLRNLKSPETYFQTAFRVQSPWTIKDDYGKTQILKKECYVFDFAIERALKQIADYSCRLNIEESNPEKKVAEFVKFLPVIAYDGSVMKQVDAQEILDFTTMGTSATLLARRWESAELVNISDSVIMKLLQNEDALRALENIEGFRSISKDLSTIISKSDDIKKAKKEKPENLTEKEKKKLTEDEKERKDLRKKIRDKLIKFITRIPIFMYLTDYREQCLKDVITQLESGLFKKVTGLEVNDFKLLCDIGVFNTKLMDDAVFKFKRYEDASLVYTGIDKRNYEKVGGYETVISREEYEEIFYNQPSLSTQLSVLQDLKTEQNSDFSSNRQLAQNTDILPNSYLEHDINSSQNSQSGEKRHETIKYQDEALRQSENQKMEQSSLSISKGTILSQVSREQQEEKNLQQTESTSEVQYNEKVLQRNEEKLSTEEDDLSSSKAKDFDTAISIIKELFMEKEREEKRQQEELEKKISDILNKLENQRRDMKFKEQRKDEKKELSDFDESRIRVGAKVLNKKFGYGEIIAVYPKRRRVRIKFAEGEKLFIFEALMFSYMTIQD